MLKSGHGKEYYYWDGMYRKQLDIERAEYKASRDAKDDKPKTTMFNQGSVVYHEKQPSMIMELGWRFGGAGFMHIVWSLIFQSAAAILGNIIGAWVLVIPAVLGGLLLFTSSMLRKSGYVSIFFYLIYGLLCGGAIKFVGVSVWYMIILALFFGLSVFFKDKGLEKAIANGYEGDDEYWKD
ncbi:hypothetical protein [Lactococcus termiticola]|uniref:Uncharacterized protein n=1 Tax=Lactococcus termiticola TaxID=2169526 RepID=A0A2R5HHA5_9LACT|nr:hypothetical protein [Lactococcus termiticola]GBG97443.1 hypothetical protein NtB2_01588 [Lactococcus termiticola]